MRCRRTGGARGRRELARAHPLRRLLSDHDLLDQADDNYTLPLTGEASPSVPYDSPSGDSPDLRRLVVRADVELRRKSTGRSWSFSTCLILGRPGARSDAYGSIGLVKSCIASRDMLLVSKSGRPILWPRYGQR